MDTETNLQFLSGNKKCQSKLKADHSPHLDSDWQKHRYRLQFCCNFLSQKCAAASYIFDSLFHFFSVLHMTTLYISLAHTHLVIRCMFFHQKIKLNLPGGYAVKLIAPREFHPFSVKLLPLRAAQYIAFLCLHTSCG